MKRARYPALLCLGFLFAACGDDVGMVTETAGTETDTDTDPTTTTTSTTLPTTTTTDQTTTTEAETETTAVDPSTTTDTDPTTTDPTTTTDTDTDPTTTTGPECEGDEECAEGEMCVDGACVPKELTLCDRLGGMPGINTLNTNFVLAVLADQRINGYFLNDDVDGGNLIACVDNQIGEAAGCPGVVYDCLDMVTAHAGLGISTQDFVDFAEDYSAALDFHQANDAPELTNDDKDAIMGILAGMAPDMVEDETDDATVYQRVGRKPAVIALIGAPTEVDSFVDNVANNPEINGFFAASDFERLNTCLTRQVSSIDGPIKYGQEVDSPAPGIDPGVALDNKCLNMCDSHAGLVDENNMPISLVDFSALVGDLITAMTTAGVSEGDQMAILGVLGPMCTDIVADPYECPGIASQELAASGADLGVVIPDNTYDGSLGSMACVTLEVPDPGDGITSILDLQVNLGIDHTWVGDLVIKLVSPDNEVITLMSRPGHAELADDGEPPGLGDSSDLLATFPVSFGDAFVEDAETMGDTIAGNEVVCRDDNRCDYFTNKGAAAGADSFAEAYQGASVVGEWQLCVGDRAGGDTGTIQAVTLTFQVTEPVGCN